MCMPSGRSGRSPCRKADYPCRFGPFPPHAEEARTTFSSDSIRDTDIHDDYCNIERIRKKECTIFSLVLQCTRLVRRAVANQRLRIGWLGKAGGETLSLLKPPHPTTTHSIASGMGYIYLWNV